MKLENEPSKKLESEKKSIPEKEKVVQEFPDARIESGIESGLLEKEDFEKIEKIRESIGEIKHPDTLNKKLLSDGVLTLPFDFNDKVGFTESLKNVFFGPKIKECGHESDESFIDGIRNMCLQVRREMVDSGKFGKKESMGGHSREVSKLMAYVINSRIEELISNTDTKAVLVTGDFSKHKNSHFWVQIGNIIIDACVTMYLYSEKAPGKIRNAIKDIQDTKGGLFVGTKQDSVLAKAYHPRHVDRVVDVKEFDERKALLRQQEKK